MNTTHFETLIPKDILPHQAPMLLIDKVLHTDFLTEITTASYIHQDLIFLKGHFPDYPLLPGIIIIEMMFQACGILGRVSQTGQNKKRLGKAVKIKSAVFYKEVRPGDMLIIKAVKVNTILNFSEYTASATVNGQVVCKAEITAITN